ncbi:MFS transporter [Intrasporangium oryzae NRRL B-24470]|uniref:MFS transporter n=1 Tax=Intrasporangium oryzae NRRL B-24470 TaxID=1386089 RepID=W9G7W7_9MICO|nr:MFS transporter [Intrasporangium oryzae]EWT00913.1 MFS transporter [Intrasporangium oryzae NRRL B-24470]
MPAPSVTSDRSFVRFWIADAVSNLGTFVSTLAIQLLLIDTLHADQRAIGFVRSAQWLPYLLFGVLAGVVVDRVRRRPLLVAADVLSAVFLGTVAALALAGRLTVPALCVLVFLAGSASMFFIAAHQSFLPSLVPVTSLPTAWARLEQTTTAAQSIGPLVGGLLVRTLTAPVAVLVDAVSYAVSAVLLATLRVHEPAPARTEERHVWRELKEGAHWVYRHRMLAPYAVSLHLWFFANAIVSTVLVYFAATELHLDALAIGVVLAAAGVSGVVGAGLGPRLARRYGMGRVVAASGWLSPAAYALLLLAQPGPGAIVWPVVANLVFGFGLGVRGPLDMSYRNMVTPDRLRGRMNATIRSLNWGSISVAAPLAGAAAATWGNRVAIGIGIAGLAVAAAVLSLSPYREAELAPVAPA